MIVEDKEKTINKANNISANLLHIMTNEVKDFECIDDPAEHIYLLVHIISNLSSKVCLLIEEYGKIYGIDKLDSTAVHKWIKIITRENIKLNRNI